MTGRLRSGALALLVAACGGGPEGEAAANRADVVYSAGDSQGGRSIVSQAEHDQRIDYIELAVKDVADAKRFYGSTFGWRFEDYGPDYASFADGRLAGGFRKEATVSRGGPLVVVYALDLAAIEARIKQAGGKIVRPTFEFPGGRRFHFTDPSGNELAVWSDQ